MFSSALRTGSRLKVWKMKLCQLPVAQLGQLDAGDAHGPGGGFVEPREDVHERRLARPGRPHDRREPRAGKRDVDVDEGIDGDLALAEALAEITRLDDLGGPVLRGGEIHGVGV
jgi:hypothetical protein